MNRRSVLKGVGTAAIGGSAILGSGALSQISSARTVTINVTNDSDSVIALDAGKAADGIGTIENNGGKLTLSLTGINADSQLIVGDAPGSNPSEHTISSPAFKITDNAKWGTDNNLATAIDVSVSSSTNGTGLGLIFLPKENTDDLANANTTGYTPDDQDSVVGSNLDMAGTDIAGLPSRYQKDSSPDANSATFLLDKEHIVGAELLLQADAADLNSDPSFDITISARSVDAPPFEITDFSITDQQSNQLGSTAFGNFNPLNSAGTTYLSVTNNSNSSATVTASNSSVTVTDTNGTTNPSVSGGGTLDIEVSHSAGSDQTSTLEFTGGNQTVSTTESVAIPVAPSNAVARYSLAGNTNDVWGSNNGSSPSSSYVTGANQTYDTGDAISLDSDVLDLVDSVSSGQTYTAWVKPASDETRFTFDIGWHYNVDKGYGVRFYPGETRIYPGNGGTDYDPNISFGAWNHVAMVDDGSSITLYIDGQKELTVSQTPANGYENTGFLINTEEKQGEIYDRQTGDVDDVRVYDTVLTDDEIADLYNTGHISP